MTSYWVKRGLAGVGSGALLVGCAQAQSTGQLGNRASAGGAARAAVADPTSTGPVGDEIVVTGVRASIQRAQEIKRRATSVVESITLEDLGKFSDTSISDALQRVPGVNIERNVRGYEGADSGVTIRGLGPDYVVSTLNGRELLGIPNFFGGGTGRTFDYEAIPPEILGGVTIYKQPTAELIEPGLAGEVNIQTLRPLDVKTQGGRRWFANVSVGGELETQRAAVGPRIGGVAGIRLFDGTLGLYVSGLYSHQKTLQKTFYNYNGFHQVNQADAAGNITTLSNVLTTDGYAPNNGVRGYTQKSGAAGLQWKPNRRLEVNVDYIYNVFVTDLLNRGNDFYGGFSFFSAGPNGEQPTFRPGSAIIRENALVGYDSSLITLATPTTPATYNNVGLTHVVNTNELHNVGANAAYTFAGGAKIALDATHGANRYFQDWRSPYADNLGRGGTNSTYDGRGELPVIGFTSTPTSGISDPASYGNFSYFYFQSLARGTRDAVKLDLSAPIGEHLTLKVGARYADTHTSFVLGYGNGLGAINPAGFFSGGSERLPFYPQDTPIVSEQGFCRSNPAYCAADNNGKGSFVGAFPTLSTGKPGDALAFQSGNSYAVRETNLAIYGQADLKSALFGVPFAGNLGLRAVRINERGTAFRGFTYLLAFGAGHDPDRADQTTIFTDEAERWHYLPAFNLTVMPSKQVNLRAGVARTISLPSLGALAPSGNFTLYTALNGANQPPTFSGGNIRLKPTQAWNYDLTAEYYTNYGGAVIVSGFYKDVTDLVTGVSAANQTVPGGGTTLYNVSSTINAANGYTYGVEVNTNQPFTFLPSPLDGFGVQANYTFVVSHRSQVQGSSANQFIGSSKHNVNIQAYFEKWGYAARVAFAFRSAYLYENGFGDGYRRPESTVDVSLSKKFGDHLELIASGTNLTGQDQVNYNGQGGAFRSYFERPITYTLAVRLRL